MKSEILTKVKKMKERTRDKKAYAMLGRRSFDLPPTLRLLLDPSSSLMDFSECEREYAMNLLPK